MTAETVNTGRPLWEPAGARRRVGGGLGCRGRRCRSVALEQGPRIETLPQASGPPPGAQPALEPPRDNLVANGLHFRNHRHHNRSETRPIIN